MKFKKGNKLYIRIDTKLADRSITPQEMEEHLDYIKAVAKERHLVGGGFTDQDGGCCLYEAASLEDARAACQNDPLIRSGLYRCEVFEWTLMILSEDMAQ